MEDKDHVIPKNKKAASIFFVCMLLLCVGMLILVSQPFQNASEPEDLVQVSCSFDSYEIKQHTRSFSYDLLLFSDTYDILGSMIRSDVDHVDLLIHRLK